MSHGFMEGGTAEGAVLGLAIMALIRTHPDPAAFSRELQGLVAELQMNGLALGIKAALPLPAIDALKMLVDEGFEEGLRRSPG